jgi:isoquinoline 1-oxidoreductase alpha subunit
VSRADFTSKSKIPPKLRLAIAKGGERLGNLVQLLGFHEWPCRVRGQSENYTVDASRLGLASPPLLPRFPECPMLTIFINRDRLDIPADFPGDTPLLWLLRDHVGLTGAKYGCGMALCGACTVHIDGAPTRACSTPISSLKPGIEITTIEGLKTKEGQAVQAAWDKLDVVQCGYCQPGQVMSATALLAKNKRPTDADIDQAMAGNVCRCATYVRIRAAIKEAAKALG